MTAAAPARRSDLARALQERGEVVGVERFGALVELVVRLPHLAVTVAAGEFAQLRCGDGLEPLLRRPMSVAFVDGELCSFVLEAVGRGTALLAALRPGDHLDVLGPLGVGFALPAGGARIVCVSGGVGCAPFPLTARRALEAGAAEVVVLSGAATAGRLYPATRLRRGDRRVRVVETTDDGSRGARGLVTELVASALADGCDALFACGPNPMLAALARLLARPGAVPAIAEVSLEAPMGCGFGTCLGCALPVRSEAAGFALCCRDGPAMAVDRVDWERLTALPPAHVA